MRKECTVKACQSLRFGHGFCQKHYLRWRRHGDAEYTSRVPAGTPLRERIEGNWRKVPGNLDSDCWEWQGRVNQHGYGLLKYQGRNQGVHRLMYQLQVGDIPKGQNILHKCDNPPCINPRHLVNGTQQENIADMVRKGRQSAPRGLSDDQVRQIRAMVRGGMKQAEVVRMLGVESSTVSRIVNRKLYREVE